MNERPDDSAPNVAQAGPLAEVCRAFREKWRIEPPAQIEFFLKGWEEPDRSELFRQLVRIDLEFRRHFEHSTFPIEDYYGRFPNYRAEIETAISEALIGTRVVDSYPTRAGESSTAARPEPQTIYDSLSNLGGSLAIELKPGDVLGDYELIRRLGEGAFAVVYLALERSMKRRVALKISRSGRDEPPTLAQLDHPNVVRVFGVTRLADRRLQLMSMEYVPGGTLQDVVQAIQRQGTLPASSGLLFETINQALAANEEYSYLALGDQERSWQHAVCEIGAHLATALAQAHRKGIFHRDIKPANVLLCPTGAPKLADFNIAFGSHISAVGVAGYFGGTLAYMSPEQLEACDSGSGTTPEDVDHRSDIYSLAVVLWQLLTGKLPFADHLPEYSTRDRAAVRRKGPSSEAVAALSSPACQGIRDVLLRCLASDPADRYPSAGEFARDLRLCTRLRIHNLIHPPRTAGFGYLFRHALLTTVLISLLPNFLLSVANVLYDWFTIVRPLQAEQHFLPVMVWGKLILYGMGIAFGVWRTWHVFLALQDPKASSGLDAARRDCLALGDLVFGITLTTWVTSGLLFPLWIDLRGAELPFSYYLIFFASHLLCGLISGDLVVSGLSYLSVRSFYPRLLTGNFDATELQQQHARLRRRLEIYYLLAVAVPFISALALGFSLSNTGANYWPAFLFLGLLGIFVLLLGTIAKSEIRKNLEALDEFVDLVSRS